MTEVHISDIAAWCKIEFDDYYANPLYNARRLFLDSEEIKDLVIPDDVTSIGYTAFYYCSGLTSITIPNSVTSIGKYAFQYCSGLTSVELNCENVGSWFSGIKSIETLKIGNSVTSIEIDAFYGCSGLTSVMVEDGNEVYDSRDNCNAIIETATNTLIVGSNSSVIPNSVTSIGKSAFSGCDGLTSVTIPNSVTSIGGSSFSGCSGLTSVTIPNSVTSIEWYAFAGCSELTDVYCYAEEVPSTWSNAFEGSYVEYAILHVPDASIEDYKATTPWSSFGKIVALTDEEMAAGVEEIGAEDANSNDAPVYNINGMKMQNADNLPAGIYIKGGKKFMVK